MMMELELELVSLDGLMMMMMIVPIVITLVGIVIDVSDVHPANISLPISNYD